MQGSHHKQHGQRYFQGLCTEATVSMTGMKGSWHLMRFEVLVYWHLQFTQPQPAVKMDSA
jgi:hypothetical protein